MADMGTKEAAEKWCREGKISPQPTQDKKGSPWHIEVDAKPTKNN